MVPTELMGQCQLLALVPILFKKITIIFYNSEVKYQ